MKALITGASSRIGREFSRYLAELGYDLIVCARRTDELYKLRDELSNVSVRVITLDLSREHDAFDLYEHLKLDGEVIDVLINNAGSTPIFPHFTFSQSSISRTCWSAAAD